MRRRWMRRRGRNVRLILWFRGLYRNCCNLVSNLIKCVEQEKLRMFERTYYRKVLVGLDDDAILDCAIVLQGKTVVISKYSSSALWEPRGYQCSSLLIE